MAWEARYLPPDPNCWQARADMPDDSCFAQHIRTLNLLTDKPEKSSSLAFALIGFKCDEGVQRDLGRAGATEGPTAIRQSLRKLPIQTTHFQCYDAGNIICLDHDLEASQEALGEVIAMLLANHIHPLVMGGGHEAAWGQYLGIKKAFAANKRLGIINFDAHFDMQAMQPSRNSASTTFYQIAEDQRRLGKHFDYNCIGIQHAGNIRQAFELAKAYGVNVFLADDMHQGLLEKTFDFIDRVIDENDIIYLTLSLDVFSPAFAPGVSSIQPLGVTPWHVIPLLRQAAASGKVVSYDIVEHVPRYDIDHRTAKLAATLIYDIIHHHIEQNKNWSIPSGT